MSTFETKKGWQELKKLVQIMASSGEYQTEDKLIQALAKVTNYLHSDYIEVGAELRDIIAKCELQERNVAADVEAWVLSTDRQFMLTEVYNVLHLHTRNEKKNVSIICKRLLDKGTLVRAGDRQGCYRLISQDFKRLEHITDEDSQPISVKFPLDLERYAKIFKTNIIIIAGQKDAGKTGFALNFATKNSGNGKQVRYISSEFGADELKNRLKKLEMNIDQWLKNVEFGQFMRNNIEDAVIPEAINIIDYLEVPEGKFYLVAERIKNVYQKLTSGIALICLQKAKGQEYARGAELSAEKARLYVTLGREKINEEWKSIATILHCKNRAMDEINPNGLWCEYRLVNGFFFKRVGDWLPR